MINVLLISPSLKNKGGISTVVKNILEDKNEKYNCIHVSTQKDGFFLIKIAIFIISYFKILYLLKCKKIDLVHVHIAEKGSFTRKNILIKMCKKFNKKVILHHHGAEFVDWFENEKENKKDKIVDLLEQVDLNVVLSNQIKEQYVKYFNLKNLIVLYNGTKPREYLYNSNGTIVLFLGRIGKRKGAFDLLESIKTLDCDLLSKYKFYFCGDGEIKKLKKQVIENNLENRVKVCGWINQKQKNEIFKETVLNVLPSYNEGLPMSILECMSYGIPCLSTKIAAIPEVIDEKCGKTIEPGDINALCVSITQMLYDESLRNSYSKNSYVRVSKEFTYKVMIEKIYQLYEMEVQVK